MTSSEGKVVLILDIPPSGDGKGVDPSICDILISLAFRLSGDDLGKLHSLMTCTMAKYIHDVSAPVLRRDADSVISDIGQSLREYSDLMRGDVPDTGWILRTVSVDDDCDEGELVLEPFNHYEREHYGEPSEKGNLDIHMEVDGLLLDEILGPGEEDSVIALCVIDPDDDSVDRILAYVDGDSIRVQDRHGCGGCNGCGEYRYDGGDR